MEKIDGNKVYTSKFHTKKRREHIVHFLKNFVHVRLNKKPIKNLKSIIKKWHHPTKPLESSNEPLITWIGHSTFLIQVAGINILTDPLFFPISFFFPRLIPPGIKIDALPIIDMILISHDHRDHLEKQSIIHLAKHNPIALVPKGLGKRLARWGLKKVVEHSWGDNYTITTDKKKTLSCTFLPASHWAGSNIFNMNRSQYGSWIIEANEESDAENKETTNKSSIYFAGDTSYDNHFKEIAQQFSSIDGALLPVGPLEPRHLVEHAHLDVKQALQAFIDLKAKQFIPMHWGTLFHFGTEDFEEPIDLLKTWWQRQEEKLKNKTLKILKFGKAEKLLLFFFARIFV